MKKQKSFFDSLIQVASIVLTKLEEKQTAKPQIEDAEYTVVETKINSNHNLPK